MALDQRPESFSGPGLGVVLTSNKCFSYHCIKNNCTEAKRENNEFQVLTFQILMRL
jgi:hypothetical protein